MALERKLFGTDGVRGEVGAFLTAELAMALGRAAVASLEADRPQVLIVRDTRESGPMLESALAAGVAEAGGDALLGGVLPTPAAAILVKRLGLDLAVVVSASHNPYRDNGIKFFSGAGTKLSDEVEAGIEGHIDSAPTAERAGRVRELDGAMEDYLRALEAAFPLDLKDVTVALDCANGATHRVAPIDLRASRRDGRGDRGRARRPEHQRRLRIDRARFPARSHLPAPRRRSGSPSTVTATGCWRSTGPAAPTTATS